MKQPGNDSQDVLSTFEGRVSDDELKSDLELTCTQCGVVVCDIENADTLDVLVRTALDHECVRGTCRHCGRSIVYDKREGWIDPEAGHDDEDGDGIWRTTCDAHDTFIADHEPEEK